MVGPYPSVAEAMGAVDEAVAADQLESFTPQPRPAEVKLTN